MHLVKLQLIIAILKAIKPMAIRVKVLYNLSFTQGNDEKRLYWHAEIPQGGSAVAHAPPKDRDYTYEARFFAVSPNVLLFCEL